MAPSGTYNLPDYYETFNRNYDATIGRFIGVDPKAESAESLSSYQYANNNPIFYNDPMGDKSASEWNEIIGSLWNSAYGGSANADEPDPTFYTSEDQAKASVQSGGSSVYSVDFAGNIHPLNTTTDILNAGQQKLYAVGYGTWNPNSPSIIINSVDIDLSKFLPGDDGDYYYFNVHNTTTGWSLFSFLATNTHVEWSLLLGPRSYISTSHDPGTENGGPILLYDELNDKNISGTENYTFIHDHPAKTPDRMNFRGLYGPSGYYKDDSNAAKINNDKNDAEWFERHYPKASILFGVMDETTGQLFFYGPGMRPDPSYLNFSGATPANEVPGPLWQPGGN